ncbi:MAG: sterol desaturase family protein [Paracoccaceae bacterium]
MNFLFIYGGILLAMMGLALIEAWQETAEARHRQTQRWPANLALATMNAGLAMVLPLSAVSMAVLARSSGWGIMNILPAPAFWDALVSVLVLTLTNYGIHRAFHQIPILWKLHEIHHSDARIDSTTAFRHHPLEVLLTLMVTIASIVLFGVNPTVVLLVSFVDQAWAVWTHSAQRLPLSLHRWVCLGLVTPLTHRVHHSSDVRETDKNFGNTTTLWDRVFGTHLVEPIREEGVFQVGLAAYSAQDAGDLDVLLTRPFRKRGSRRTVR